MTRAFVASGTTVELGGIGRPVVDKHSTGGVGDAVSLVFAPLVAALGLACVKISGRGLGHTGGTIDKLEAIPGFRTDIAPDAIREQATSVGCVIAAQTADLVPADGAVYALRDATATVRSIPLIAASVMAKKLAIASDLIVLDVKAGSGAFMADPREAAQLVDACLAIARRAGRDAAAAITDMSQPLGTTIGNALEVAEAIEVLRGQRAGRLRELSVWLAGRALARLTRVDVDTATERAAAAPFRRVCARGAPRDDRRAARRSGGHRRSVVGPARRPRPRADRERSRGLPRPGGRRRRGGGGRAPRRGPAAQARADRPRGRYRAHTEGRGSHRARRAGRHRARPRCGARPRDGRRRAGGARGRRRARGGASRWCTRGARRCAEMGWPSIRYAAYIGVSLLDRDDRARVRAGARHGQARRSDAPTLGTADLETEGMVRALRVGTRARLSSWSCGPPHRASIRRRPPTGSRRRSIPAT